MTPFSEPFERFVAPARARSELWRLALGCVVVLGVYAGFGSALVAAVRWLGGGTQAGEVLMLLGTAAGMGLGAWAAVWGLHQRRGQSLFGPRAWLWRDLAGAVGLSALVLGAAIALWWAWFTPTPNLGLGPWAMLLPLSLALLLVQTGAEEVLFRGYLQSQLAARFPSPLAWAVVPSLLFAMAHYNGDLPVGLRWALLAATALFGLLAADLTARTGGIGAAWGLHFVNNVIALLIVAQPGAVSGLALYVAPYASENTAVLPLVAANAAITVLAWAVLRWRLAR